MPLDNVGPSGAPFLEGDPPPAHKSPVSRSTVSRPHTNPLTFITIILAAVLAIAVVRNKFA
jgi:hypothetical protein